LDWALPYLHRENLATCWTVTNLPGIPPASCKLSVNPPVRLRSIQKEQLLRLADLPHPIIAAPEAQLAQWDDTQPRKYFIYRP
jgi:hypothetical protein